RRAHREPAVRRLCGGRVRGRPQWRSPAAIRVVAVGVRGAERGADQRATPDGGGGDGGRSFAGARGVGAGSADERGLHAAADLRDGGPDAGGGGSVASAVRGWGLRAVVALTPRRVSAVHHCRGLACRIADTLAGRLASLL